MFFILFYNDWIIFLPELFFLLSLNLILAYFSLFSVCFYFDFPILTNNLLFICLQLLIIDFILILNTNCEAILFNKLIIIDFFGKFLKTIALFILIVVLLSFFFYNKLDKFNNFEFILLFLFLLFGTFLLIASFDLITFYLSVELQSFCSYVLACLKRTSEFAVESSLKYFILGSFSSGFLLFGISLLYGFTGSTCFEHFNIIFLSSFSVFFKINFLIVGLFFILISFFLKIGVAPFHFVIPDFFEGAPFVVVCVFSMVPKIGLFCVFTRFVFLCFYSHLLYFQDFFTTVAFLSMIFGCFGSIWQSKIKRLLGYNSVNSIGYIFIGLSNLTLFGLISLFFYLLIYIVSLLSIFLIFFVINKNLNLKRIKYLKDLNVLAKQNIFLGFCLIVAFFSMIGIPPLAGFFSKMFIFLSAIQSSLFSLIFTSIFTSTISCFYFLRIIQISFFNFKNKWISLKKVNFFISVFLNIFMLFLFLFFLKPNLLFFLIHNIVFSLCLV